MNRPVRIVLLVALPLACLVPCAQAQTQNMERAEALLVAMRAEDTVTEAVSRILYDLFVETPEFDAHQDIILDYTLERLGWDVLKPEITKIYAQRFTETEIAELTDFYASPTGQKLLGVSPAIMSELGAIVRKRFDSDLDILELRMKNREMDLLEEEDVFFKEGDAEEQETP